MIIEDYCSFETAMLLKEKGFDAELKMYWFKAYNNEPILNCCPAPFDNYEPEGLKVIEIDNSGKSCDRAHWWRPEEFDCIAPTIQMAMKWLREVHNLFIEITVGESEGKTWYDYDILPINGKFIYWKAFDVLPSVIECNTLEEAAEIAIKYCLEHLI